MTDEAIQGTWRLASYRRRVGAWAIDTFGFFVTIFLCIFTLVIWTGVTGVVKSAFLVVSVVMWLTWMGYVAWWLVTLRNGQTPGKRLTGIRVIKDDGIPSGWRYTFLREFVIKGLLVGSLVQTTVGIAGFIDYLWPLWDRAKKRQTLHDKLLGTIVVKD